MESDNNFCKTSLLEKDVNSPRFRRRYNKLTLVFKFFFFFLILIIAALFIYLVHDIASDLDQSIPGLNPGVSTESQISLQTAAKELEDASSFILYSYLGSNIVVTADQFALKNCWRSLQTGSARIRDALEVSPFSGSEQKVDDMIVNAEENIKSCLDDLEKVESTAAIEVKAKALRAKVHLRGRGDFLRSYGEDIWQKLSSTIVAAWDMVCVFIVCMCGLQLLFVFYLLWGPLKFR